MKEAHAQKLEAVRKQLQEQAAKDQEEAIRAAVAASIAD